jgi:hypothetical protein
MINGTVYTYTAYDDGDEDEDTFPTLTLASPGLTAASADDDWVNVYDPLYSTIKTTKAARVRLLGATDNDDTIRAEFAQQLLDKLSGGIRGTIGEECLLELDNTTWRIIEIFGLDDPSTGLGSGARWEADDTYTLTAADITAGTATFPLTHQPIDESLMAVLGIPQPPTEYSIDYAAQTITWPLDGWEEEGDVIWVHYEYQVGVRNMLSVPMGAVWKYATGLGSSTTYADPAFDDSAWSEGPTPFGYGVDWTGYDPKTGPLSPLSNVWNRLHISTGGGDLTFAAPSGLDDEAWIYLDGSLVVHWTFGAGHTITVPCSPGNHVVAVYGLDTASPAMFIAITVSEEP